MDLAQTRIDLYLYIRKIKLDKLFLENQKKTKPDKFEQPVSTLPAKDAEDFLTMLNLNALEGEEISLQMACPQLGAGLSEMRLNSKFYPQLPPGNKVDLFQEAIIRDLYKLKKSKHRDNLSKEERDALKNLSMDNQIEIKIVDKGGNVVIWDREAYIMEAHCQLEDETYYEKLKMNPTLSIKK